jgi:hypothetical protein
LKYTAAVRRSTIKAITNGDPGFSIRNPDICPECSFIFGNIITDTIRIMSIIMTYNSRGCIKK